MIRKFSSLSFFCCVLCWTVLTVCSSYVPIVSHSCVLWLTVMVTDVYDPHCCCCPYWFVLLVVMPVENRFDVSWAGQSSGGGPDPTDVYHPSPRTDKCSHTYIYMVCMCVRDRETNRLCCICTHAIGQRMLKYVTAVLIHLRPTQHDTNHDLWAYDPPLI